MKRNRISTTNAVFHKTQKNETLNGKHNTFIKQILKLLKELTCNFSKKVALWMFSSVCHNLWKHFKVLCFFFCFSDDCFLTLHENMFMYSKYFSFQNVICAFFVITLCFYLFNYLFCGIVSDFLSCLMLLCNASWSSRRLSINNFCNTLSAVHSPHQKRAVKIIYYWTLCHLEMGFIHLPLGSKANVKSAGVICPEPSIVSVCRIMVAI